ncbi:MAG: DUF4381 family protein [Polyangia bacterium]
MSARTILVALVLAATTSAAPSWAAPTQAAPTAHAEEDIRDIRGPVAIPRWWPFAAGGLALLMIGGAIVALRRRRRERARTPEERALEKIENAQVFADRELPREYAIVVSDALRSYIEERFELRAEHATTDEFLDAVTSKPALVERRDVLAQFLAACDLAKFARFALPADSMQSLQQLARQFVVTTHVAAHPSSSASGGVS